MPQTEKRNLELTPPRIVETRDRRHTPILYILN